MRVIIQKRKDDRWVECGAFLSSTPPRIGELVHHDHWTYTVFGVTWFPERREVIVYVER